MQQQIPNLPIRGKIAVTVAVLIILAVVAVPNAKESVHGEPRAEAPSQNPPTLRYAQSVSNGSSSVELSVSLWKKPDDEWCYVQVSSPKNSPVSNWITSRGVNNRMLANGILSACIGRTAAIEALEPTQSEADRLSFWIAVQENENTPRATYPVLLRGQSDNFASLAIQITAH